MCNAMGNVTCATLQRYGKMLNGQTLKCATSDYDQRHVIAFRPISEAARSWSYNNTKSVSRIHCHNVGQVIYFQFNMPKNKIASIPLTTEPDVRTLISSKKIKNK